MFELLQNPFVVLGVTPRSTKADINEAFEDALLDADGVKDERSLNLARQAIFTPNERVAAELGYLLELRPSEARKALKSTSFEKWVGVAQSAQGVARANAFAEAVGRSLGTNDSRSIALQLLASWSEIDPKNVWLQIKEERSLSDFGTVSEGDVRRGLDRLREAHADKVVASLDRNEDLPTIFTALLDEDLIPQDRMGDKFTSSLVASYAHRTSGSLANAADHSLASLKSFVESGSDQAFQDFEQDLSKWDRFAQPLQLANEIKGADELHSQELYEQVRSYALELANEAGRHDDAARITRLAESVFAELPAAAVQLRQDSEALDKIVEHSAKAKALAPLVQAITRAREDLFRTSQLLSSHGFMPDAPDPIGTIRRCIEVLLTPDLPLGIRDAGVHMVRGLAIEMFNEREDILNAKTLTSYLAGVNRWFSKEVCDQIANDDLELAKNLGMQRLKSSMKAGEWKRSQSICAELRSISSGKESANLQEIDRIIDEKLRSRRASIIVWGGIAAMAVGFMIFSNSGTSDYSSNYDYGANAGEVEMPAGEASGSLSGPVPQSGPDEGQAEIVPTYGLGTLALPQLRYCVRQGERLNVARGMVESYQQQSKFNAATSDYNLLCGSYRYDYRDMATVRAEIGQMRDQLSKDASQIVGQSGISSSPSYSLPSAPDLGSGASIPPGDEPSEGLDQGEVSSSDAPLNAYGETGGQ